MARRSRGTSIKRSWDLRRIARGLAAQGIDLRHWVSYGTVATVGADGGPNFADPDAILVTPAGVEVDVILEPSGYPVTCKYGIQAGTVYAATPIHEGDQVIVILPDGDVSMVPWISCIVSGSSDPIPVGPDGLPIFQNDRALIFAKGVPIELRTDAGNRLLINPDGTIQIGDADAMQQLVLGTTYRGQEGQMNQSLIAALQTFSGLVTSISPSELATFTATYATIGKMIAGLIVFVPLWLSFVQAFEAGSDSYLSIANKTK